MKTIAWLAGIGTLVASAAYMIISLNRWEWNRALFFGLIVLIAEVGLATGLVLRRLARHGVQPQGRSRGSRHPPRDRPAVADRFAWLREPQSQGFNVFITFLVGGGVILSAIAWLVDRVASKTSSPAGRATAWRARSSAISYPSGGLLLDDITVLAQEVPGANDDQIRRLLRRGGP